MAEEGLSPQLQDQITRLQQLREQLSILSQQRQQIDIQLKEIDEALTELKNTTDKTPIYRSIGSLLIKVKDKKELTTELSSNKETLELRKNTIEKQEGRSKEKLTELQSKVENALNLSNQTT